MDDLTRKLRDRRLDDLIRDAHRIYLGAVDEHIASGVGRHRRDTAAVAVLYSGGNDSTVLAHLMRRACDVAVHCNTGIGIEATRQFVRDTTAGWGLPLLERHPPIGSTYDELVLERGFPGPAQHWKMYQRLKGRALEQVNAELVPNPYRQRVVFLAGRRRDESTRRAMRLIPESERRKSIVWVSPLLNWTALDLNTYRMRHPDLPRNPVTDLLHMSGECLCGAFAKPGELDEIGTWFPAVRERIQVLERKVAATGGAPPERCRWGWGAYRQSKPSRTGPLCSSCTLFDSFDDIPASPSAPTTETWTRAAASTTAR